MTPTITFEQITARLDEQEIACAAVPLENRATLVVTSLGGRIFAFLPDREGCLFWTNPAFADPNAFAGLVRAREWNIGGDRVWVGPEIQFIVQERSPELGRYAYLHQFSDREGYLLVRAFYSQPGASYLEEPAHVPGCNGHSAFIYKDDGGLGGFGEFECMGAAIGGAEGPAECLDRLPLWVYAGEPARLRAVMRALLGVERT